MQKSILIILVLLFSLPLAAQKTKQEEKAARLEAETAAVKKIVDNGVILIDIERIQASKGPVRNSTDGYTLKIEDGKLTTYLPYFGQVHMSPIDPSKLSIDIKDQEVTIKKTYSEKRGYNLKFTARMDAESFDFSIDISNSGYTNISLNSSKRDFISYSGELNLEPKTANKEN